MIFLGTYSLVGETKVKWTNDKQTKHNVMPGTVNCYEKKKSKGIYLCRERWVPF